MKRLNFIIIRLYLILIVFYLFTPLVSQSIIPSNRFSLPIKLIMHRLQSPSLNEKLKKNESRLINPYLNISFQTEVAINSGHPNIDNNAEFYALGRYSRLFSYRLEYGNRWINLELEPYLLSQKNRFNHDVPNVAFQFLNNQNQIKYISQNQMGLKQSRIILHYNGIGIGYGNMSHWWSPGFHNSIALSSNANSQETYSFGSFKDIYFGNFSFYSNMIVMPYKNINGVPTFFSGLRTHISYHSKSAIITFGLNRTYLSGDFQDYLQSNTDVKDEWTIIDAAKLVIEPLFGQSKKNKDYTVVGSPGYDLWDQILTGYVKVAFPKEDLELYLELASDDNRANITDLIAHWDHTMAFLLGGSKYFQFGEKNIFLSLEYLRMFKSNTEKFYRAYDYAYYTRKQFDYFSYKSRMMGAHAGPSSDDLILLFGLKNQNNMIFTTFNRERHGIKNVIYPEIKTEYSLTYQRKITQNHTLFITLEHEKVKNFRFKQNNISVSKLIWMGYSFSFN